MSIVTTGRLILSTLILAVAAVLTAPLAAASPPTVGALGDTLEMTDTVGQVQYSWRVAALQPSSDTVPGYPVAGRLWEATATVHAVRGTVTPAISQFNAVAPGRDSYRVLWQVAAPTAISGATIAQGASATGKIYFDVTGADPSDVTMNNGMEDLLIWRG
ncbi:MPT63 family protein [Mycolicibacillus parakoreensis]|uniref:MPT63 family protein n=1 Tax=Mycolicibacillus parakoreensis TaxID=1069221 RepID=A0ABY3U5C5_9MYCO|nr:MPT63 family protein [Mycolicibacillus parakoreensis]MCV7316688.1 MPT63 family protein [Mycolicibacillus parakoreensis]ULN54320.1 MPT63 family protein [Mycolicibacillus parakoreensis]HLR98872.1 MPT63 family protein [Mycolicibacillus parakoreensis]